MTFASPPTYANLDSKKIAAVTLVATSRAHVDTQVLKFLEYWFVVLKKRDGWRIDSLKCRMPPNTKWDNTLIGMWSADGVSPDAEQLPRPADLSKTEAPG